MLYAHAAQLSPETAKLAFKLAREEKGTWTLDEFKGWFNYHCPGCARAGAFAAMYVFYALYLAIKEQERANKPFEHWYNERGPYWGPSAGGPMRFYAPVDNDSNASVVDAVFADAERKRDA